MARRRFPFLLFFFLLFAQVGAYAHALGHFDHGLAGHEGSACELCVAYAAGGAAACPQPLLFPTAVADIFLPAGPDRTPALSALRFCSIRAPPPAESFSRKAA